MRLRLATLAVATSLLAGSCSALGGGSGEGYTLTAYFPKAVALYEQGAVKVLGLPAGRVAEMAVEGDRVRVELRVDGDVPLPADVRATIVPASLIGERYVQLFPAWTTGDERANDGDIIPMERTSIPVEPDEALAALKEFLDTLDPNATGRLIKNLAEDLDGNGQDLNAALKGLADLTTTFAEKDAELAAIIENFDTFTATLRTREGQLGAVLDNFAAATGVLAQERASIEQLLDGLAVISKDGLDLVSEHAAQLDRDIAVLGRTLRSVRASIDSVRQVLSSGPVLVAGSDLDGKDEGTLAAYDPKYHHIDLRSSLSPTLSQLFNLAGVPSLCVPIDTTCPPGSTPLPSATSGTRAAGPVPAPGALAVPPQPAALPAPGAPAPAASTTTVPASPIDGLVDLLGSSDGRSSTRLAAMSQPAITAGSRGSGLRGWLARNAFRLIEVIG